MKRQFAKVLGAAVLALAPMFVEPSIASADHRGTVEVVAAHSTDAYSPFFVAGELVQIGINGDHTTDLDLIVRCDGQIVAQDLDYSDTAIVRFIAPRTGSYRIEVINRGDVWNRYVIVVDDE